jgi:hypothetical protein
MSTIKSDNSDLTINASGSTSDIKFQANGVEKASISAAGAFTSTTIDATALTGNLPAISGASLTNLPASGLPTGTKVAFFQASAPTDWTQDTSNTDAILRVVSGTGGGTGGTAAVSSPAHSLSAGAHTTSIAEMPSHNHMIMSIYSGVHNVNSYPTVGGWNIGTVGQYTESKGGGGSHSHTMSGSITTPKYIDMIICTKD